MRILITEDNGELAEFVQEALKRDGYLSDIARSASELRLAISQTKYNAIILDLGLPDTDGLLLLQSLRKQDIKVPVLILTARGNVQDRIKGLDFGADDYLTKPFSVDELIARIRAILRRPSTLTSKTIECGNVTVDLIAKTVRVNDFNVILGKTEFAVLECLIRNVGLTVSKSAIEQNMYQHAEEFTDNALQVAIHRVRKKLNAQGATISISSIRGIGYLLR